MGTEVVNMKTRVAAMVTTPLNSCVRPWSKPSPTWSTSLTTREM